jgi:hypothetical protein
LSPVNSDFIGDMLARKACPVVQSARQQERRMVAGMLQRPDLASVVLAHLPPKDMLFDSHRDIAVRLAEAAQESGLPSLAQMIGKLEQDDTAFADAVDIALDEEPYDASRIVDDVRLIREARLLRSQAVPLYKGVRLYNVSARVVEREEGESLAELEQQVREGLANGTLTPDDPTYQRYMEVRRQLQGDGELPVWDIH